MFRLAGLYSMLLTSVLVMAPARAWAVDTDGDGVDDLIDVCCNTPLGIAVDGQGRPIGDFDGDCDNDLADYAIYITGFTGPLSGPTTCIECVMDSDCVDNNVCTMDTCVTNVCQFTQQPDGYACDDGDFCTVSDACSSGSCVGQSVNCDDSNPCTDDVCTNGACVNTPNNIACDDGDGCTVADTCSSGSCVGQSVNCDDSNPCTDDACMNGSCVNTPNNIACDDGDGCTVADTCSSGSCTGMPKDCAFLDDQCNIGTCNPTGFFCEPSPLPAGTLCDDGNVSTINDQCDGTGVCIGTN